MKRELSKNTSTAWLAGAIFGLASAAHGQVLDSDQIQMLLGQAQQIEQCMTQANTTVMQDLHERGERISAEIESLCKSGQREAAQAKALAFGHEMADSPVMASLQECAGALGALLPAALASFQGNSSDAMQVCDVQ